MLIFIAQLTGKSANLYVWLHQKSHADEARWAHCQRKSGPCGVVRKVFPGSRMGGWGLLASFILEAESKDSWMLLLPSAPNHWVLASFPSLLVSCTFFFISFCTVFPFSSILRPYSTISVSIPITSVLNSVSDSLAINQNRMKKQNF